MTGITDLRVRAAQKGDKAAFEAIVSEQHARLYHVCLRMMASPEDAADMMQEVWVKVWRNLPRFKGDSSLSTWLYRVAMNTCLDELRRRKKGAQVSMETLAESGWEPTDPQAEELLERSINRELLLSALSTLAEDYRAVLVLRDLQGMAYEEISAILNIPLGTVRSRLSRARKQMAKNLLQLEPNFLEHV